MLTVPTTDGEDFFGFVQRHAELWKLGRKGKDNGVLIVLVPKSARRKGQVRIQSGYGHEGVLTDSWCGSLSRKVANDYFRAGRYGEGVFAMTVIVANKIANAANVKLTGMPKVRYGRSRRVRNGGFACGGMTPLIIMMVLMSAGRRRRNYGRWGGGGMLQGMLLGSMMGGMLGGGRSSWGGGGGFGGGFGGGGGFGRARRRLE